MTEPTQEQMRKVWASFLGAAIVLVAVGIHDGWWYGVAAGVAAWLLCYAASGE